MYSGVEGGDSNHDLRVDRCLFADVEVRDVYGYCPGRDVGRSCFGFVSKVGIPLSGYFADRLGRGRFMDGCSGVGEFWGVVRDRGKGVVRGENGREFIRFVDPCGALC